MCIYIYIYIYIYEKDVTTSCSLGQGVGLGAFAELPHWQHVVVYGEEGVQPEPL